MHYEINFALSSTSWKQYETKEVHLRYIAFLRVNLGQPLVSYLGFVNSGEGSSSQDQA